MLLLSEIFYWVLNMSILGGFIGLIVALVRKIPKLPRFAAYLLWALPLIRLWVPFGIASRWSLLNLISKYTTKTVVIWKQSPGRPDLSMTNSLQAAEHYFPITYKADALKSIFEVASVIWAILAAAAVLTVVLLYTLTKREIRNARHLQDNLWISDRITSPAVYGIIKPKIVLPEWITERDMPLISAHEGVHIRRWDNLWRMVAVITACIHWFNPLSWLFLRWFFGDMELACDAKVLKDLGEDRAKDYAAALLNCSNKKNYFASTFGGAKTGIRIEYILTYRKLTLLSTLSFGTLVGTVAFVLITNAMGG